MEENDGRRSLERLSCSCLAWAGTYLKLEMRRGIDGRKKGEEDWGWGWGGPGIPADMRARGLSLVLLGTAYFRALYPYLLCNDSPPAVAMHLDLEPTIQQARWKGLRGIVPGRLGLAHGLADGVCSYPTFGYH